MRGSETRKTEIFLLRDAVMERRGGGGDRRPTSNLPTDSADTLVNRSVVAMILMR